MIDRYGKPNRNEPRMEFNIIALESRCDLIKATGMSATSKRQVHGWPVKSMSAYKPSVAARTAWGEAGNF